MAVRTVLLKVGMRAAKMVAWTVVMTAEMMAGPRVDVTVAQKGDLWAVRKAERMVETRAAWLGWRMVEKRVCW